MSGFSACMHYMKTEHNHINDEKTLSVGPFHSICEVVSLVSEKLRTGELVIPINSPVKCPDLQILIMENISCFLICCYLLVDWRFSFYMYIRMYNLGDGQDKDKAAFLSVNTCWCMLDIRMDVWIESYHIKPFFKGYKWIFSLVPLFIHSRVDWE